MSRIGRNLINAQCPILTSHPKGPAIADANIMLEKIALSNQLEERLIDFAACIIDLAGRLQRTFQARHIANQIMRSGTAGTPNYAEAPGLYSQNAHHWKGTQ